jgi:uncharacterized protein YjbI with pentapeptide repeats
LQGALFDYAQLQGASLSFAKLQGASFQDVDLEGVWFEWSQLQGAWFNLVDLTGATLRGANLQGAVLESAQLQGASFRNARLQGAWFITANLNGAWLPSAELQGALFEHDFVWMADARTALTSGVLVIKPTTGPEYDRNGDTSNWSVEAFDALNARIKKRVPEGLHRDNALERIATLDPGKKSAAEEEAMGKLWADLDRSRPRSDEYQQARTERLRKLGCSATGAPYVIHGLLLGRHPLFASTQCWGADLAAAFLDEVNCPGAHGLSEEDKASLRAIRERTPPSASPPQP